MNKSAISILVVEDEAMTAVYMKTMLRKIGFNVLDCVSSGEEAFDYILKNEPDLIIMDIQLAGIMNGIDTAQKISSRPLSEVQFVFATGYSDPELKEHAMRYKPLHYFVKPVKLNELVNIIEQFFRSKR